MLTLYSHTKSAVKMLGLFCVHKFQSALCTSRSMARFNAIHHYPTSSFSIQIHPSLSRIVHHTWLYSFSSPSAKLLGLLSSS